MIHRRHLRPSIAERTRSPPRLSHPRNLNRSGSANDVNVSPHRNHMSSNTSSARTPSFVSLPPMPSEDRPRRQSPSSHLEQPFASGHHPAVPSRHRSPSPYAVSSQESPKSMRVEQIRGQSNAGLRRPSNDSTYSNMYPIPQSRSGSSLATDEMTQMTHDSHLSVQSQPSFGSSYTSGSRRPPPARLDTGSSS